MKPIFLHEMGSWNLITCLNISCIISVGGIKVLHALPLQECMRGSFAKAHVLYAPVQEIGVEDRLLHACCIRIYGIYLSLC